MTLTETAGLELGRARLQHLEPPTMAQDAFGHDAETLEIRAIEVTTSNIGDAQMLPGLLEQILQKEPIASIIADGAFDTKCSHMLCCASQ